MSKLVSSLREAAKILKTELPSVFFEVEKIYPFLISEYYLGLIDKNSPSQDPIFLQSFPSLKELSEDDDLSEDPQEENYYSPVPKLIHRYKDRALILTTNKCSSFCRFCFRKRYRKNPFKHEVITSDEFTNIVKYIQKTKTIEEIILSGGDPLMLPNSKLKSILDSISNISQIKTVRIASRIPVTLPERITQSLVKMLSIYKNLWVVTHFNHPNEITKNSKEACEKIISAGIPMLNQTVLLKGINDSPEILRSLFRELVSFKVKPYYLFHVDPVKGVSHFATGIDKGLEIMRYFRENLSGIATPDFSIDLPEGGGKVRLQPSYSEDNKVFESIGKQKKVVFKS